MALIFLVLVVSLFKWWQAGSPTEKEERGILRNLTTMVGNEAPPFTLTDSEGRTYNITPGNGRKHVLIFHMGSI